MFLLKEQRLLVKNAGFVHIKKVLGSLLTVLLNFNLGLPELCFRQGCSSHPTRSLTEFTSYLLCT